MLQPLERARIRLFLGYPDFLRAHHTRLESVLSNVSDEGEILVRESLAKLVTIESALTTAGTTGAGVKRVDEIWFENGSIASTEIRKLGRRYVSQISIILGVPIYCDCFGGGGYFGDKFSGYERGGAGFYNVG